jgi:hypothetical protein
MSAVLHARCDSCGRGAESCQWCENTNLADWEAMCDCGLADFGAHLLSCRDRGSFQYVIAIDHAAADLPRSPDRSEQ